MGCFESALRSGGGAKTRVDLSRGPNRLRRPAPRRISLPTVARNDDHRLFRAWIRLAVAGCDVLLLRGVHHRAVFDGRTAVVVLESTTDCVATRGDGGGKEEVVQTSVTYLSRAWNSNGSVVLSSLANAFRVSQQAVDVPTYSKVQFSEARLESIRSELGTSVADVRL
uniref:Uncharacterized protein n=1 Tax=Mycena chlorophos TaxID=658473 RepID=A0ABQ0L7I1_MYCCL|nr:predicted protein [Mycena chlorophos]